MQSIILSVYKKEICETKLSKKLVITVQKKFWNEIPKKSIKVTTAQIKLGLGVVVKENFYCNV